MPSQRAKSKTTVSQTLMTHLLPFPSWSAGAGLLLPVALVLAGPSPCIAVPAPPRPLLRVFPDHSVSTFPPKMPSSSHQPPLLFFLYFYCGHYHRGPHLSPHSRLSAHRRLCLWVTHVNSLAN